MKKLIKFIFVFILIAVFLFNLIVCGKEELTKQITSPPTEPEKLIMKTVEEPALDEIFLKIKIENASTSNSYLLKLIRNDSLIFNDSLPGNEITFLDTALSPATKYVYTGYLFSDSLICLDTASLILNTMDTTSHNFQWEIYHIGESPGSVLIGVTIVNENDIWAVGNLFFYDSTTTRRYNAAHWNGTEWELIKFYYIYNGDEFGIFPIRDIYVINPNRIWLAAGSIFYWNGNETLLSYQRNIYSFELIHRLLFLPNENIYGIGGEGIIVHYNGTNWIREESGTKLFLSDIYAKSSNEIYSVGLDNNTLRGIVLKYNGIEWKKLIEGYGYNSGFDPSQLFKTQLYGLTEGVWGDEHGTLYTVGNLMYQYRHNKWNYVKGLPYNTINSNVLLYRGYLHAVRGNESNDMFVFGERETVIHFNGSTWKKLGPTYNPFSKNIWYNCDVKGNIAVGVGKDNSGGRIIVLRR